MYSKAYTYLLFTCVFVHLHSATSIDDDQERLKKRETSDLKIVCYYSNWAVYRPGLAKFTPQNINPYLCTHLIYAFAGLSSNFELKAFDPYNDIKQGNYQKFTGLKAYNNNLKTLIAVGGWNEGSKRFSKLVATDDLRDGFVKSAVRFLREHDFDGLDLDWEYPGFRDGSTPEDKYGYATLVKELRDAFDAETLPPGKERLLLSIAMPAGQEYIDQGFDVPKISKNVDFMNILTYDFHSAYDPETEHHAPLSRRQDISRLTDAGKLNVEWTVNYYVQKGADKLKMIIGVPTYGRSYTLSDPAQNGLGAPADGPGEPGPSTREKGYLAYYEICQRIEEEGFQVENPSKDDQGPYAYKGNQWMSYDDVDTIRKKARFIVENNFGGAMVWTLDNDDFRGICKGGQSPLINGLRASLLSNYIQGSSTQQNNRFLRPANSAFNPDSNSNVVTRKPGARRRFQAPPATTTPLPQPRTTTAAPETTPDPPTTPEADTPFECQEEGFFKNPKDCRKYFWCLDSGPANLGIVAHAFTCPSGLYFNTNSEACDYPQNTKCKQKGGLDSTTNKPRGRAKATTTTTTTTTTTPVPTTTQSLITQITPELVAKALELAKAQDPNINNNKKDPELTKLLDLVHSLGGIEKVESLLKSKQPDNGIYNNDLGYENYPHTRTTAPYYEPSYQTPKRQDQTLYPPTESTVFRPSPTQEPRGTRLPKNQVRPRRPQFDRDFQPAGPVEIFPNHEDVYNTRLNPSNEQRPPQSPFNFIYNTPERMIPQQPPPASEVPRNTSQPGSVDGFFVYNNPGRFSQPSTRTVTRATEAPPSPPPALPLKPELPPNTRIRVVPGPLRDPDNANANRRRRPSRVQVVTAGERRPTNIGRDIAEVVNHNPVSAEGPSDNRPIRRRPPQRARRPEGNVPVQPNVPLENTRQPTVPVNPFRNEGPEERPRQPDAPSERSRRPNPFRNDVPQDRPRQPNVPVNPFRNEAPQERPRQPNVPVNPFRSEAPHERPRQPNIPVNPFRSEAPQDRPRQPNIPANPFRNEAPQERPRQPNVPVNPFRNEAPQEQPRQPIPPLNPFHTESPIFPTHAPLPAPFSNAQPNFTPVTVKPNRETSAPPPPPPTEYPINRPYYEVPSTGLINRPYVNPFIPQTTTTTTPAPPPPPPPIPPALLPNSLSQPSSFGGRPLRRGRPRRPTTSSPVEVDRSYQTTPRPRRIQTQPPPPLPPSVSNEESGRPEKDSSFPSTNPDAPPITIEGSGQLTCNKRGVHPHPNSCSQYIVCAPSKKTNSLKSYSHHCPAEQVFVKEVGRCRPGNRDRC